MGLSSINGVGSSKVHRVLAKANKRNGKTIAQETELLIETKRAKNLPPQPYYIMPELNFLVLWKWMNK